MPERKNEVALKRRVPVQARSRKRLEAILDAAADVFAASGFDAATMEAVAARAGTSIGSVYQFFPNKRALFQALADRSTERARSVFESVITAEAMAQPGLALLEAAIDAFAIWLKSAADVRAVLTNYQHVESRAEADAMLTRQFVERVQMMINLGLPKLPPERCKLIATMLVQVSTNVLLMSLQEEPSFAREMVEETKRMLKRYVAGYAEFV